MASFLSPSRLATVITGRPSINNLARRTYYSYVNEPAHPVPGKKPKWSSAAEAVSAVKSGDTVFIQGAAATPRVLVPALAEQGKSAGLKNVKVHHIHTEGAAEYNAPELAGVFRSNSLFTGANSRAAIAEGKSRKYCHQLSPFDMNYCVCL